MTLENFFSPNSVAIIGASHTPGKIGYIILENFVRGGFKGKIFPVNPDTTPILGLQVYESVKEIPEKVDLAVIAVPATLVPRVLKECVEKKIPATIIISSGFSEIGKAGDKLEEEIKKIIAKGKIRVIGPNVVGIFNPSSKVDTIFLPADRMLRPKNGSFAFITQSGAVGSTIIDWLATENVGISKFVSYGNAADVNESDLLEFLSDDEDTKVIAMYLEGIRSTGKKFIETLKKVTKKKPVLILKAGKGEKGTKAVASHTGSLAGSAKIYSTVFKQFGAIETKDWEELFDFAKTFSMQPLPKGEKLLIITDGGGFGILATDEAEKENLQLIDPPEKMCDSLKKILPSFAAIHNPLDLTADADADMYKTTIENAMKNYDGIVVITLFQVPTVDERLVDYVISAQRFGKPIICCAVGSDFSQRMIGKLEQNSVPVFPSPERAVRAFAALRKYSKFLEKSVQK